MNILSYVHPIRTYLPCTGVGRHINNLVLGLNERAEIDNLKLLFSQQWLTAEGRLDPRSPLAPLPFTTFPSAENTTERNWKMFGLPQIDRYIPDDTDWLYAPVDTYLPTNKCPVAITIHDIQAFETDLPWSHSWQHRWFAYKWSRWVPKALKNCRAIFTVSEFSKQRMVDLLNADPHKIVVVGNGVDRAFFDIANSDPATLKPPIDRPYLVIVGGLRSKKGADYVLAVAKVLSQRQSDLQIVVAGESEASYVAAAREHPNILLLGMVSDLELPQLLRCASSLLFLSLYEGFGIPALEAMAAGIPTIVADRASLPEIVGKAGFIVDPTNPDAIVEIAIELAQNSTLRADYIERGYQQAAGYTWASCVDRALTAFKTLA
jgi:glycosyltransferase involved in cell wall biosynthesis